MWFVDLYRAYFINPSRFQVVHSTGPALLGVVLMGQESDVGGSWSRSLVLRPYFVFS